jgi:LmbE family N-acetylglucosaminyl deacetylase
MSDQGLSRLGTTVLVWAHPDDETYLSGAVSAALVDQGLRVVAVTATRGEAGGPGTTPAERAETARTRTAELEAALRVLGVTEHVWLEYEDGRCDVADPEPAVGRLSQLCDEVGAETVLTFGPDGFTGHPDHRAVSRWVDLALARARVAPRLLHAVVPADRAGDPELDRDFGVYDLGSPRVCDSEELSIRLDLAGEALRRKVAALQAQASQTAGLIEAVGIDRFAAWVATEAFAAPARATSDGLSSAAAP